LRSKCIPLTILLVTLVVRPASAQSNLVGATEAIRRGNERYSTAEYIVAIKEYERVTKHAGDTYSQALYNIGVCYYELWRTEDAIVMYRKAVGARAGRYPAALYALGVALEDLKRRDDAKDAYLQVVATSSGREVGAAHFRLGLLLAGESEYEKAATHFTEVITRESSPASHNNLGVVLALKGRLREAEREFERALREAAGSFPDATNNLKLCQSLLKASTKGPLASLRLVATAHAPGK